MIGILKTLMVVMNLNIYVVCEKKYCCLLIWIFFGSQDSVGKTRMNFKETTTMLWVFFLSFCYLICLIFVLALLLNFFNVASSTRPVCFFLLYFITSFFNKVYYLSKKKKKISKKLLLVLVARNFQLSVKYAGIFVY